ncbi:hypothetical protein [Flavobacterium lotistagni]|nr:hypothetical protein [Flavobacterium lotistagni]
MMRKSERKRDSADIANRFRAIDEKLNDIKYLTERGMYYRGVTSN